MYQQPFDRPTYTVNFNPNLYDSNSGSEVTLSHRYRNLESTNCHKNSDSTHQAEIKAAVAATGLHRATGVVRADGIDIENNSTDKKGIAAGGVSIGLHGNATSRFIYKATLNGWLELPSTGPFVVPTLEIGIRYERDGTPDNSRGSAERVISVLSLPITCSGAKCLTADHYFRDISGAYSAPSQSGISKSSHTVPTEMWAGLVLRATHAGSFSQTDVNAYAQITLERIFTADPGIIKLKF